TYQSQKPNPTGTSTTETRPTPRCWGRRWCGARSKPTCTWKTRTTSPRPNRPPSASWRRTAGKPQNPGRCSTTTFRPQSSAPAAPVRPTLDQVGRCRDLRVHKRPERDRMCKVTALTALASGTLELTSGVGSCVSTALTSTLRNSRHNHDMTTHNIDKVSASLADRKEAFHGKSRYMVEYRADMSGCMAVFS